MVKVLPIEMLSGRNFVQVRQNWLIQTFSPIVSPCRRCSQGRRLPPLGTTEAIQ